MGCKYTQPLTPSQTERLENEWEMNTFRFLSIFSPTLENICLVAISSTHSEQRTFISFIPSAKELLSKHQLIYKPVRFGLLRRWQSCPITSSGCCRGTHTSIRSWRGVRAAAIAIVSEEMGRKVGERERQKESVTKQACDGKSSCLQGDSDPISQNFSDIHLLKMLLYFQICNQSCTLNINHGMNIHDENWAVGKENNERFEWSSQVTTQNGNTWVTAQLLRIISCFGSWYPAFRKGIKPAQDSSIHI